MTLSEALGLVQQRQDELRRRRLFLVCGFEPFHLRTFLQGHFAQHFGDEAVDIETGLYGDLEGSLGAAANSRVRRGSGGDRMERSRFQARAPQFRRLANVRAGGYPGNLP